MHRQVERSQTLAATVLSVEEVGLLWRLCIDHFGTDKSVITRLTITNAGEQITFESIDELTSYAQLPDLVYGYKLFTYVTVAHHITIDSLGSAPKVHAAGPTVAWCAGAVDMVATFAKNHRQWYWWLSAAPLFWVTLGLLILGPAFLSFAGVPVGSDLKHQTPAGIAWLASLAALCVLGALRTKLFPALGIKVRERRGFFQKYVAELGLFFTFLSFVAAIVSIYISLRPAH